MKERILGLVETILRRYNLKLVRLDDKKLIKVEYLYNPKPRSWAETPGISEINKQMVRRASDYANLLLSFSQFRNNFETIPVEYNGDDTCPYWLNTWLPVLDAISIYGLLATRNPSVYFEIGSGNSTKFARRAIEDHRLRTKIISLDPYPRTLINNICDETIRTPCENAPLSLFENLPGDTILFVDGTHRSFPNSDVTVFFTEILPSLPRGCTWGLHDIPLPFDYSTQFAKCYFNEQYLLMAYLLGGGGNDKILLPNNFISTYPGLSGILNDKIFDTGNFNDIEKNGTCMWMQREN
jgi:hypothetical protein